MSSVVIMQRRFSSLHHADWLWGTSQTIRITYSECVFLALDIQHTMRMRRTVLPSEACLAVPCLSTLCHKLHEFQENVTEHKMYVLIFCTTFVWKISHSEKNWARYCHKYTWAFVRNTGYYCQILLKHEFSRHFQENTPIANIMKRCLIYIYIYINTHSVPRSKHTPSLLQKPVS